MSKYKPTTKENPKHIIKNFMIKYFESNGMGAEGIITKDEALAWKNVTRQFAISRRPNLVFPTKLKTLQ